MPLSLLVPVENALFSTGVLFLVRSEGISSAAIGNATRVCFVSGKYLRRLAASGYRICFRMEELP